MKKEYKKPDIMFESFASSVNIAGDCEVKTDTSSSGYCGVEYGANYVFMNVDNTQCTIKVDPLEGYEKPDGYYDGLTLQYDRVCYHIPYNNVNLFNS